jgi:Skp family chaperone for outer membrane proteins
MKALRWFSVFAAVCAAPMIVYGQGPPAAQNPAPATNPVTLNLPTGRFAVINTNAFAANNGIQQLVQQISRVNDTFKDRNAELNALQQRAEGLQREVETQQARVTPQSLADKQFELEKLQIDIKRRSEDLQAEYSKAISDATQPVVERINEFLDQYAKKNNITLLLEAAVLSQARGLAYVHPDLDITQDFMKAYNAANPVATASAATPPKSGGN